MYKPVSERDSVQVNATGKEGHYLLQVLNRNGVSGTNQQSAISIMGILVENVSFFFD